MRGSLLQRSLCDGLVMVLWHIPALYDATLSLIYPQDCAVCGASVEARADGVACRACWQKTRAFTEEDLICWKCGVLAPGAVPEEKRREVRCRRCDAEHFTAARACGVYEKALRASVLALKREPHVAPRLARLLFETGQREPLRSATRIVPVPLHAERLRERGFNQATMLGDALAQLTRLPLDEWSLVRTVHTERHRAGMDERACCGKAELRSIEMTFLACNPRSWRTGTHSMTAPSGTLLRPCSRRTLKWSSTSPSRSSLTRKPKPRVASNHFTRPTIAGSSDAERPSSESISGWGSPPAAFVATRTTESSLTRTAVSANRL